MTNPQRWASFLVLVVGAIFTLFASIHLDKLEVNGDLYGLLGDDDPAVVTFREMSEVTTGLEELLVICEADQYLPELAINKIVALTEVDANTRTYTQPGKSSLYAFSLTGDPADFRQAGVAIDRVGSLLVVMAPACGMAGTPAYIVETHDRLDADLLRALCVAVVLVTLLFAFIYRIGWLALLMLLPVGIGIAWGLAAYSLMRPELTLLAAAIPTLLIGIGIDHCIHMIQACRYAMKNEGLHHVAAVVSAWRRVVVPISVASATTIVMFCGLAMAELRGFADLGLAGALVSAGVYLACVSLLPVMLFACPEKWLANKTAIGVPMQRLAPWIGRNDKLIAGIAIAVTLVAAVSASKLEYLNDIRQLEGNDLQSRVLQERIADEYELTASPIIVHFDEPEHAVELMADDKRPASIASLVDVPDVPGLVHIHPANNPFLRDNYKNVIRDIERQIDRLGLGQWQLSGAPAMNARIDELLYADIRYILPLVAGLILLTLAIGLRSISLPFIVLLPLVLSLIWMTGSMAALGVAASVVTAAIIPMVLGIGVDGGVHLVASWRRRDGDLGAVFAETGLAIAVTITTSIAAFGAFIVAMSPSLLQFGAQAAGALFGCLIVTLLIVPAILQQRRTRTTDEEQ